MTTRRAESTSRLSNTSVIKLDGQLVKKIKNSVKVIRRTKENIMKNHVKRLSALSIPQKEKEKSIKRLDAGLEWATSNNVEMKFYVFKNVIAGNRDLGCRRRCIQ